MGELTDGTGQRIAEEFGADGVLVFENLLAGAVHDLLAIMIYLSETAERRETSNIESGSPARLIALESKLLGSRTSVLKYLNAAEHVKSDAVAGGSTFRKAIPRSSVHREHGLNAPKHFK